MVDCMTCTMTRRGRRAPLRRARPFEGWSIELPATFRDTFITEGSYWHAYDRSRSVSLTSVKLRDGHGPVSAGAILRQMTPVPGERVSVVPPGLSGWARAYPAVQPARASRALSGILVQEGAVLIVTITSDDSEWARRTWLSIRAHPVGERAEPTTSEGVVIH
jgi:hypothetical protein